MCRPAVLRDFHSREIAAFFGGFRRVLGCFAIFVGVRMERSDTDSNQGRFAVAATHLEIIGIIAVLRGSGEREGWFG